MNYQLFIKTIAVICTPLYLSAQQIDLEKLLEKKRELDLQAQQSPEPEVDYNDPYSVANKALEDAKIIARLDSIGAAKPAYCTSGKLGNTEGAYWCSKIILTEYANAIPDESMAFNEKELLLAIEMIKTGLEDGDIRAKMNLGIAEILREDPDILLAMSNIEASLQQGDFTFSEIFYVFNLTYDKINLMQKDGHKFTTGETSKINAYFFKWLNPLVKNEFPGAKGAYDKIFAK